MGHVYVSEKETFPSVSTGRLLHGTFVSCLFFAYFIGLIYTIRCPLNLVYSGSFAIGTSLSPVCQYGSGPSRYLRTDLVSLVH